MGYWPLIIGHISAGFPSAAEGYEDEPLNLNDWLVTHPAATYLYRVRGNALHGEGICDGSLLVVDRAVTPQPGRIVLIEQDGEFVVCRYRRESTTVCGVVVAVVRRV